MRSVRDVDVHKKIVFLRCDFNVPLKEGQITEDHRIRSAIPTIKYLLEKKAKIIIGTHIGRPKMPQYEAGLSTVVVAKRLSQILNKKIHITDYVIGPEVEKQVDKLKPGEILMLGNLRFHRGEELNDSGFAQELASMADIYINDAFAVCHRENASDDAITRYCPSYSGFLLESEMTTLSFLLDQPEQPFVLVVGGIKVEDKVGFLKNLESKVEKVLLGGVVANTFLVAKGEQIGQSLYDKEMVGKCKDLLMEFGDKIMLPIDFIKEESDSGYKIMDIGPKSIDLFYNEITNCASVFWNGNMGYTEDKRYEAGTRAVAAALQDCQGNTVIAGGDTANFVISREYAGGISFISTGGRAAMEYLAGVKLPGIVALDKAAD